MAPFLTNYAPPLRGGAEVWPETFSPHPRSNLQPAPLAMPRPSYVEGPASLPIDAREVARWPELSGIRAQVEESPATYTGAEQRPWALYASDIPAETFGSWTDDCCEVSS